MNELWDDKDVIHEYIEKYIPYYEWYLDHLGNDHWIILSDNVRLKNISEFKQRIKVSFDSDFMTDLLKKYDIMARFRPVYEKNSLREFKRDIESWEVTILTLFKVTKNKDEEPQIREVVLLKRKKTFWNFRERVKKLAQKYLPQPAPQNI